MAGAGLEGIKRRIKSVSNTKKITKAMGLVATAKLRKCKDRLETNEPYYKSFNGIIDMILGNIEDYNVYKHGNKSDKKLYVVITSDSGFCGSFNGSIVNRCLELLREKKENSMIMVVGSKGISYFNRYHVNPDLKFIDIQDVPTFKEAKNISIAIRELFENEKVGEVNVVYTKFVSSAKQEVFVERMLPFGAGNNEKYHFSDTIKYEPESSRLLDSVIESYLVERVYNYLINSKSSEQSLRMAAMDGATKNADELLEKLKLQYNRIRQGAITQEISEIVGGAEAQK